MKSALISIKPKYCELIANGKKTIEVRKTKPKLETPFKCYIYCTKAKYKNKYLHTSNKKNRLLFWHNKGDCEIICEPEHTSYTAYSCNGKVIGEFVCDDLFTIGANAYGHEYIERVSCLSHKELEDYQGEKTHIWGWHISDLKIYDKPKELYEFEKPCPYDEECWKCKYHYDGSFYEPPCCNWEDFEISRPPQSWCYVEELV